MSAPVVAELPTSEETTIGRIDGVGERLIVGESFQRTYQWEDFDSGDPADFSDYVPTAQAIDSAGAIVGTPFTVTPFLGDATGRFTVAISNTQTTTTMRDNAVAWTLSIMLLDVTIFLICSPFNLEDCTP